MSESRFEPAGGDEVQIEIWHRAMVLLERWIEADAAGREALLAQVAAQDARAHACLRRLIAADADALREHFLDHDALSDAAALDDAQVARDISGQGIGSWRIERLLGSGGAGQVWLARRDDGMHEGVAALKLLHAAVAGAHARERFAREGRLLSRLQHEHIARLLDAGQGRIGDEPQARRFLVLEYIEGERIDAWCDRRSAAIEERLRLFLQVCAAVSYAHSHLIVHRDLKPSNILVQKDGCAKLLDFGVAKLIEDDVAPGRERAELTRAGGVPFTPEYAAPELFEHAPVSVATDVYSLAVVLYQLLAGRRPLGADRDTRAQLMRRVLHEEPKPVSVAAVEDASTAKLRATTPAQLRRRLRGDLDTILFTALRKAPAERYASVHALATDVRRHLDNRPIRARRGGLGYRARKFFARHRLGAALGAGAALVLIAAAAMLIAQSQRLRVQAARATAIKEFLFDTYLSADVYHTAGAPAGDVGAMLGRGAANIAAKLGADADTQAEVHATFARIFVNRGAHELAREHYVRAGEIYRRLYGADSLKALTAEADAIANDSLHGDFVALMPRIDAALALLPMSADERRRRIRWRLLDARFVTARDLGDLALERASAQQYLDEVRATLGGDNWEYTFALWRTALAALDDGAPARADAAMREVIAIDRRLVPAKHPGLVTDLLATVDVLIDYGNYRAAAPLAQAALEARRNEFGAHHRAVADATYRSALVAAGLGEDARAEREFAAALALGVDTYSLHARDVALTRYAYALHLLRMNRRADAARQFADCTNDFADEDAGRHWLDAACASGVAYLAARGGDRAAIAQFDALLARQRGQRSRELPTMLWLRGDLAAETAGAAESMPRQAWLDEAAAILATAQRSGTRLAADIEAARKPADAAHVVAPAPPGAALAEAAHAIIVAPAQPSG